MKMKIRPTSIGGRRSEWCMFVCVLSQKVILEGWTSVIDNQGEYEDNVYGLRLRQVTRFIS